MTGQPASWGLVRAPSFQRESACGHAGAGEFLAAAARRFETGGAQGRDACRPTTILLIRVSIRAEITKAFFLPKDKRAMCTLKLRQEIFFRDLLCC
jgi:hypothetical protein